ncbi:hypothetical protein AHAS_Ahas01G0137700 [Arachis hypogaea]
MVNCSSGLILLKMLSEYIDMNNLLPPLSSEVVSGLKSSTSKHLALASQVISFTHAIIPGRFWEIGLGEQSCYSALSALCLLPNFLNFLPL